MKFITTLFTLLYFNIVPSFAQVSLVTCNSVNNPDNSISIYAESQAYGECTVKVIFTSLTGYTSNLDLSRNIALATVEKGRNEIIKLTPDKSGIPNSLQYQYQYFPGIAFQKAPDSSFVYLLPSNTGNHLRISNVTSLRKILGQKETENFHGTGFEYKAGDTICASRAGVIYDCNESVKESENLTPSYKSDRNRIAIEYKDGSLGNYDVLAPIHLLVATGDYVYPGQPLAVFNKESERYTVLFSTYYLDEEKLMTNSNDDKSSPTYFLYVPTLFCIDENSQPVSLQVGKEYSIQHPIKIITAEMSKKEKKKLGYK